MFASCLYKCRVCILDVMARGTKEDDRIKPPIVRGISSDALLAKIEKIRKSILNKQPWLWDKTSGVLLQGKQQKLEGLFKKLECTPLVCNPGLTLACDSKSFKNGEHNFKQSVGVEIRVVEVENQKDVHSGLLSEASVFGAYKFRGVGGTGSVSSCKGSMDMKKWEYDDTPRIDACLRKRGILESCTAPNIDGEIEKYLNSDSSAGGSPALDLDDLSSGESSVRKDKSKHGANPFKALHGEVKKQIVDFIRKQSSPGSGFSVDVNSSLVDSYRTRHYSVSLFRENSSGEFRKGSIGYLVKIQRTIVVATIDPNIKVGFHVPLCEEFVVWLYEIKDHIPVLKDTALVIHAKPEMTLAADDLNPNDARASHWHFFGNNAFSVHQNADHAIRKNISETSLFMAGFISGRLLDLKQRDKLVVEQSVRLFANVFNDVPQRVVFEARSIEKSSAFMKKTSSDLYKKYKANLDEKNKDLETKLTPEDESSFFGKVAPECIPKRTFLSSQQLEKMTAVRIIDSKPASPCMRMCFASFSISLVVLGPRDDANVNAVFVGSVDMPVSPQTDSVKQVVPICLNVETENKAGSGARRVAFDGDLASVNHSKYKNESGAAKSGEGDGKFGSVYQSSLPPELELELELL